ncbi:MAG: SusC/RagA family TonB-linked outer membrane protein [Gemmatimonadota bacterium]
MSIRSLPRVLLAAALAFAFSAAPGAAQTGTITGVVTNATTGAPLVSVQVVIPGTNQGGLTNQSGRFLLLNVPTGDVEVRAISLGFGQQTQTVTVNAGATATADFQLDVSAIQLEGVVVNTVTGRDQRIRELGTNTTTIDVDQIEPASVTSMSDLLSGRSEGVFLQDVNGTTGSGQRIRIRGANSLSLSNEPLVFVDGVQYSSINALSIGVGGQEAGRLNDLNPNDIQNIEIVKGPAAAALYGTAAANGVLLITTKRGRAGDAEWNFYAEYGEIEDRFEYPLNYMAYSVVGDPNASFTNPDGSFNSTDFSYCPNRSAAAGTCTQDGVATFNTLLDARTRPFNVGDRGRYGASVRGGNDRVTYFVSGEFGDETGVVNFNTLERTSVRANLNAAVNDQVDLSFTSGYTTQSTGFNSNDNSIFSPILNGLLGEAYYVPRAADADADDGESRRNYGFGRNLVDLENYVINDEVDRITVGANSQYRPATWLSLNASGGLDFISGHTFRTLQPGLLPISETFRNGLRESDRANRYTYTFNTSGVGTFTLTPNLFSTTTVGASYNRNVLNRTECFGSSLVQGTSSCGTTSALFAIDEDFSEVIQVGGYVATELAWRDRVFLGAALRGDDNSAFGTDFGFITYPSASLSWVIGEEEWFPELSFLSSFRVRTAWGTSGLRPDFRDAITLFDPTTVATPGGDVPGITVSSTGNLELKPERSTEYEVGFDAALLSDRLGVEFTYFNKKSRDALISRRLPPSFGVAASRFENLGEIKNAGTELAVNLAALQSDNLGVDFRVAVTTLDNEVVDIGEGVEDIVFNRGLQRHREGYPAGGFFSTPFTFDDADGNGLLTNDEVTVGDEVEFIGPALPTYQISGGTEIRIFDWISVSTLFEARGGNYQGNDSEAFRCGFRSTRGCEAVGNPDASLERQATYIADRFLASQFGTIEKADFIKWRELSVTLDAPESLTSTLPELNGLSLTLAGRNLATWTDYTGLDPETVEGGGSVNFSQSEFNTQPPVRYLMIRLNYNF